jgi:predicted dehydrogenase
MDEVKVAIIGLGSVAQLVHLPNLSKIKAVKIQSVAEIKASRRKAIAEKFNIPESYKDHHELLEKSEVDAVIITTPTGLHKEIAIDCLNAKKDVLVEKPIARNYNEASAMVQAAKKNKKILMVGMNLRFRPDTILLKSLIQSGEIGEPFYAKAVDLGISLVDLSLWLMDSPNVKSLVTQNYFQTTKTIEDTSVSFIRCSDSKIINIETSWALPVEQDEFKLSVYGTNGSVTSSPLHLYKKVENKFVDLKPNLSDTPSQLFKKSYLNELKSYIGTVRGLNPLFSSGEKAAARLKVIEAMYKSAKKNHEIKIS